MPLALFAFALYGLHQLVAAQVRHAGRNGFYLWIVFGATSINTAKEKLAAQTNQMTNQAAPQVSTVHESVPPTTLRGTALLLARLLWLVSFLSSFTLSAALFPLIVNETSYGDWTIESSAPLFGISAYSNAFQAYGLFFLSLKYLAVGVFFAIALYIFWQKSEDWLAILVSITLVSLPHAFNVGGYTESWALYPNPWRDIFASLDNLFNVTGILFILLIFLLFPNGRFVPRWTRWVAVLALCMVIALWLVETFHLTLFPDTDLVWFALVLFFFLLLLLATASQIYRYMRVSSPLQQAQTRIVVACLVILAFSASVVFLMSVAGAGFVDASLAAFVSLLFSIFIPTLLPLGFGYAILRDHLWKSERVWNRAVVYGALTAILLLVYVIIVGALSEVFRAANNFLIAAVATGVVALLFQPLRERIQRSINRLLYGERDEPFRVLNQLGAQLENTLAPDAALPLIVETIARAMRIPYVAIELATGAGVASTATHIGSLQNNLLKLPLRYQNESVGELHVARRAPDEEFSSSDLQLLENLARHAGAVAYTARLNTALRQSRERIINEREQERRRLRRDLHDGLGPTLASQTLKLDAAMELLSEQDAGSAGARQILQDLKKQSQDTVADIRRIVYELRPPALDDLGLVGALRAHLAQHTNMHGLQIVYDAPDVLPPLSAAIQVNAYRIVIEAVTNVVKHARASHCQVRITLQGPDPRILGLEILDDGIGLPAEPHFGVGLSSMRERAQELGGTFQIEPNQPVGTRVFARLPLTPDNHQV